MIDSPAIFMSEISPQICAVCKVKIIKMVGGDRVLFSVGPPGSRDTLWRKVCQYTRNSSCINRKDIHW